MRRNHTLILIVILAAGFFIRLWNLGEESIWIDEAHTLRVAQLPFHDVLDSVSGDIHPPLHFLLAKITVTLFGDSEFALRFRSTIFGVLSILVTWLVARRLFGPGTALVTALLLALSPFHIHYSQDGRMYALLALLSSLSFFFLLEMTRKASRRVVAGYLLSTTLLLYTHYYGVILLGVHNLLFFAAAAAGAPGYRQGIGRWLLLQGAIVLLFVPWLGFMVHVTSSQLAGEVVILPAPGLKKLVGPFITYSGSRVALVLYGLLALNAVAPVLRLFRRLGTSGLFIPFERSLPGKDHYRGGRIPLLLTWLAVPIVGPIVLSQFVSPFFQTRYTIGSSIAFYILIAAGITSLSGRATRAIAIALLIALGLGGAWQYQHAENKEPWREIAAYLDSAATQDDLFLFSANFCIFPFDYYSEKPEVTRKSFPPAYGPVDESNIAHLDSAVAGFDRIWLVEAYSTDSAGLVPSRLGQMFDLLSLEEYERTAYATGSRVTIRVHQFEAQSGGDEG